MATINDTYINALLADASYVGDLTKNLSGTDLADLVKGRMTPEQATYIGNNFTVVNQVGGLASSFDATVWRGNAGTAFAGQVYVSMRSTQETPDFAADVDLASSGLAHKQLADMVNWWLRETTPTLTDADTPQYATQISVATNGDFALAAPALGTGNLVNVDSITSVNGHSLGGYLATAFTRLFGAKWPVAAVNTFNSAGFSKLAASNIENGFNQITQLIGSGLGLGHFSSAQNNYFAQNGVNVTTNTWDPVGFQQYGTRIGMFQEDLTPGVINNHYMYKLTDVLALGSALGQLDPTLDLTKLSTLVSAASNQMAGSYEGLLDSFRKLLIGANATPTLRGDANANNVGPQPVARLDYQANLKALTDSDAFKAIEGKVLIRPSGADLRAAARNNFGALVALQDLSPVYVSGKDTAAEALLATTWKSTRATDYAAWTADKTSATPTTFTDNWLTDRAAMLSLLVRRNTLDNDSHKVDKTLSADVHYQDTAQTIDLYADRTSNTSTAGMEKQQIRFGGAGADTLTGQGYADHLYGGAGNDTLDGKAGDDYLEGGSGNDTYLLQTTGGIDTVVDSNGADVLKINGIEVKGAFSQVAGMGGHQYYSADKAYQLRPLDDLQKNWRLSAKDPVTGQYTSVADLAGWKDGQYGLTVGAPSTEPERATLTFPISVAYLNFDGAAASKGVYFGGGTKSDSFTGSAFSDVITTGGGSGNYVNANGGDDLVVGGEGRDFIRTGGNFVSTSTTPSDNDIAYGGDNSDVLLGGAGDDQLWGGYDNGAHLVSTADSGERGDWLSGENGNDTLVGSQRSDVIFGGAADDALQGGAGADLMLGDARYGMFSKAIALGYTEGLTQSFVWDNTRGDLFRVSADNYALSPVVVASGNAFSWTWSTTGTDDYTLENPAGLISQVRMDTGGGADVMSGGEGSDWMAGQTGNDTMYGGAGDDLMYGDDKAGLMTEADSGQDFMWGDAGNDRMFGGAKADVIDGGADNDKLYGEAGNDLLIGAAGDDELSGNEDDDLLDGGSGNDRLLGGTGADTLIGGLGKDQLEGGDGDDTYEFSLGDDVDVVSTASDTVGANIAKLTGGALANMKLTAVGPAWTLRYSLNDTVQLTGNFGINWAGKTYTLAEFAQAIKGAGGDSPDVGGNHAPTGGVSLTGTATQNQTLSAGNTLEDADGLGAISYEWQSSADGAAWSAIAGATAATFTLTASQVGQQVRVQASYTDTAGTLERMTSIATVAVEGAAPPGGTNKTIASEEDATYALALTDFGFIPGTGGDTFSAVRFDTLAVAGSLKLSGVAVTATQVIQAADIAAGNLRYSPAANANGAGYSTITSPSKIRTVRLMPAPTS